jgi:uncharacterized protein DUF4386
MTRASNARLAGSTFILYIAAGITSMLLGPEAPATRVLTIVTSLCALTLGVTLYSITRDQDRDLALLAMTCRVVEAIPGSDGAIFFAVASTIFCWLLLRGRMIPVGLAWLGVAASVLLVVILPLQKVGLFGTASWTSSVTWFIWLPMLVFELAFAVWLIAKGVAEPVKR